MTTNFNMENNCSKIIGIQFSILSPDEIRKGSVAEITSRDTYINNKPVIGGLFDPRMGVLEPGLICPTDGLNYMETPGYFGHIELARPVYYIQYLNTILKILRCVCFKCSKLLISKEKYKQALKLIGENRWKYVFAIASKIKRCGEDTEDGCGCLQPNKIRKEGLATIFAEWKNESTSEDSEPIIIKMTAEMVLKIFKRISDEDVNFMGFSPIWSRPDWMICQVMAVPPPAVRPSVKHDAQQRSEDDLSHILVNIIKTNKTLQEKIQNNAPANVIDDWTTVLQYYTATQVDNKIPGVASVAQRSGRPLKSIKDRLNGKGGRMRGNLMAKRVDFSARSVITADPNISIKELGIPMKIAKNITKPVEVNDLNKSFLTKLVRNGPDVHPGAKMLNKKNGESITLRYVDRNSIVLENGDIVHRHMMDGDAILFNRQPTLHRMSMMCHIAKIMKRGDTFRMNVADTKPYNADFDGDEMNLHMPQDIEAESELRNLAAVPYQIVSPANNSTIIGIYQDSMLGCNQFTRENINFTPRQAMNILMMFNRVKEYDLLNKGEVISSFDILSQIMAPISLEYKTKQYNDSEDYEKSNFVVQIKNGQYIRGQLDKSVLGATTKGLIHRTCNDFGNMASANFVDDIQNIVTEYLKTASFSVGISDLMSNEKTSQAIIKTITEKKKDVKNLIDKTQIGVFENNTGKTNEEEFETQVNNILNQATSESGKIGLTNLTKGNRFVTMVNAGSKGSDLNISFMISCLGQQNVDGKRIPYGFENRTLPHFNKFDDSPGARGFVESSYINGLSPQELFFHAMGGRVGLIDTAVKSVTWETPIVIIENSQAKYTEIGKWIDQQLQENPEEIQHFTERQMELLNIREGDVFIPTTDENGNVTWGEVTAITRHDPGTELYEIKTNSGRSVIVTESKSLLIWNAQTKKLKEMPTPEIKVGDRVPVTNNLCEPPILLKELDISTYLLKQNALFPETFELNEENGIFIGLFLSEGQSNKSKVMIKSNNENVSKFVKQWFNKHNIEYTEKEKINSNGRKSTQIIGKSSLLSTFLTKWVGNKRENRFIPSEAFISDKSFIIGILNGYYSGNGIISKKSINVKSTFNRLIEGISMLCSRLGIFGKVVSISKNSKLISSFSICAQYGKIFTEKVTLLENVKNEKLKTIVWKINSKSIHTYNDVLLDEITEINIIGVEKHPKVYDLTIPSTLNFGLANGLQVRDTSTTGYIQRRLIKGLEDLMVGYDMTIRTNKNKIVQFSYGEDGIDSIKVENQAIPLVSMSIQDIYAHFNIPDESGKSKALSNIFLKNVLTRYRKQLSDTQEICKKYTDFMVESRNDIVKYVFKNKGDNVINSPVAFYYIIHNILGQTNINKTSMVDITPYEAFKLIEDTYAKLEMIHFVKPTALFKVLYYFYLSPKDLLIVKRFNKAALSLLLEKIVLDYKRSIVTPGEMVGIISGQSIGEVSTQMTLNSVTYETPIIVRNREGSIVKIKIGDFIENKIKIATKTEYYKDKDTTYSDVDDYLEIPSCDEDGNVLWKRIEAVTRHPVINKDGTNTMVKITTKEQREVIATKAKSFLKLVDGKIVPVNGDSLKVGDYLPVSKKQIEFKENNVLDLKEVLRPSDYIYTSEVEKAIKVMNEKTWWTKHQGTTFTLPYSRSESFTAKVNKKIRNGCKSKTTFQKGCVYTKQTNMNNYNIPEMLPLDYNFGYLLGAYAAEGCMTRFQISISNNDIEYFKPIQELCDRWNITTKIYKTENKNNQGWTSQDIRIYNSVLCRVVESFCGKLSHNKFVSEKVIFSNKECILGFLDAYIGGDGTIDKKSDTIIISSISKDLLIDVQQMMNILNVYGYITKYKKQETNNRGSKNIKQVYNLVVCGNQLHSFVNKLHLKLESKQEKLLNILNHKYKYNIHKKDTIIPDEINGKIVLKNRSQDNNYSDILFDEIIKLEEVCNTTNYAYDLTIEGTRTFNIYNGLAMFDTFHFAGVASKSNVTRGVPRIEEILSLSSEPKNPSLTVFLKPQDETDKDKAQSIMYMLEHTRLEEIVKSVEICFDPDDLNTLIDEDRETIEQYKAFETVVNECLQDQTIGNDNEKSKWIIRMVMDPEVMLEKNITMDDVNFTLNNCFDKQISCVYSDYNSDKLVFRIRMNEVIKNNSSRGANKKVKVNPLDQSDQIYIFKNFQDQIMQNVVLRGIKNINKVILRKIKDNMLEKNGKFVKEEIWVLDTIGTNLLDVLTLDFIDNTRTTSNDIVEVFHTLGIEAARQCIYNELVEVVEFDGTYINYHNYSILCDRMTFTSKMISIFRHGINNDNIGPIAKASFEETPEMFLKAARHAELDTMRGISANIMCGQEGFYGTSAFQVVLDIEELRKLEEVIKYEVPDKDNDIEKFFGQIENPEDNCSTSKLSIQNNVINIKGKNMGKDNNYNPGF